jgi:uncharacterized lipoprotein YajG
MRTVLLIITISILCGCNERLVIGYPFPEPQQRIEEKAENSKKIAVELFTHNTKPTVFSAYILRNQSNIIGAYNRDKSEIIIRSHNKIDKLLQRILVAEFKQLGYSIGEKGEVTLTGQIDSFSASLIRTKEDYLLANVQVYVKVLSSKTGEILYENHYLAGSMLEVTDPPYNHDFVDVLENGLVRLVKKIMNDDALFAVLKLG